MTANKRQKEEKRQGEIQKLNMLFSDTENNTILSYSAKHAKREREIYKRVKNTTQSLESVSMVVWTYL